MNYSTAFANEKNVYEQIVNEYNKLYNISLEYVDVNPDTDINMYRDFIAKIAKGERNTLDYIKTRKEESIKEAIKNKNILNSEESNLITRSASSHITTATNTPMSASYPSASAFNVTCTYTSYYNSSASPSYTVGFPQSVSVTTNSTIFVIYAYTLQSWSSSNLDAGRRLGISTSGSLSELLTVSGNYLEIAGVTTYTEFSYQ